MHVGRRHAGELGDLVHRLGREPAVLVLREVRERQDRRLRRAGSARRSPSRCAQVRVGERQLTGRPRP